MNPWAVPSALALSLVVGLAIYVGRHGRASRLELPLQVTLAGAAVYALSEFATFLVRSPSSLWLAIVGLYGGTLLLVPAWWIATLRFAEVHGRPFAFARHRLAVWTPAVLSVGFFALVATNPWHGLVLVPGDGPMPHRRAFGPGFVAFAAYGYGTLALSVGLLLTVSRRSPGRAARGQARLLAAACILPSTINFLYVLAPGERVFNPTSLGLAVSAVLIVACIERRQLLALSPRLMSEVMRQDTEPVLLMDGAGALVHANPAAFRWLGVPESDRPPDVPERIAALLRPLREEGPLDAARLRAALLDPGRTLHALFRDEGGRWLRLSAKALPGRRGDTELVVVRLRDETGLHRTSEALAEQAATLAAILAASGDGILVVDWPTGRVRYVNRAFVEIVGMAQAPAVGDDAEAVRRAVHGAIREPEALDAAIEQGVREPHSDMPLLVATRDGRVVEGSGRPVLRDGRVVARLFQVRDVTERRRAEDSVRLSQKLESLSVMAGGIAHDFNNLLVSMLGNTELALEMLPGDAEARAPLSDVESAARRASELTRQLLAYAGRSRVEPEEVDLSAITRDVLSLIGVSIPPRVRLATTLAATPPAVVADPAQLRQVAMNLVRNAAEALGDAGGTVQVETGVAYVSRDTTVRGIDAEVSPTRPLVFLRVSDDGPGMDDDTRERIFDPFFSTKRGGRGLGLAASLAIARSHHGTIQVESAPDAGSAFTLLLPSTGRPVRAPAAPAPEETARPWRGEGRILVVDDEPGVLRVARRILVAAGFEVDTAEDGVEALERVDAGDAGYRAVLLDLTMPRLSGEETLRELRKRDRELPVLLSSGYPEARPQAAEAAEPCGFVGKPYTRAALLQALRQLLEGGRRPARRGGLR